MILRLTLLGASALAFNFSVASADEARLLDPVEVTGLRPVEGDQATVERADIDLAIPRGDATVDHVAAGVGAFNAVDGGIVGPEQ